MLLTPYIKLAFASIRSARWRSFLTMLGIIIGVASVVITVSIGEGVKKQISNQVTNLGPELITIRPGAIVSRDKDNNITGVNLLATASATALNENDWDKITSVKNVEKSVPFNVVSGVPRYENKTMPNSIIIGTTSELPQVVPQELEYGSFFTEGDKGKQVAVIGKKVAEDLFGELAPIGKSVQIRGQQFIVRGVLKDFPSSPILASTDYNSAIFMPYEVSKKLTDNQVQIFQVLAKTNNSENVDKTAQAIRAELRSSHGGEEDFTVLKQDENLAVASSVLNLITAFIAGVAAISLIVGGIGVMNIMLVLVSERTREIGVRKAVGATNRQIMLQFLVESSVISITGGILGVIVAVLANYLIRIFTDLQPVISVPVMIISVAISLAVGIIFGTAPAVRAAKKDPIESLRYE
jgi:putative ABC transport system permease protein